MIIVWGSKFYGRVDEVPDMFYVTTRFGHLWYLPLIPLGSYLILNTKGAPSRGMPIAFSVKSLLMAWVRTGLLFLMIFFGTFALSISLDQRPRQNQDWWIPALIGAAILALWVFTCVGKPFRRASYLRAVHLSEKAGISDEGKVLIELKFGNITAEEAEGLIEEARAQSAERQLADQPAAS